MKPSNKQRREPSTTVIFVLALLAAHDFSRAVASSAGASATFVEAYTRPQLYSYASRSPPKSNGCSCFDGKDPFELACRLRCGGSHSIKSHPKQQHDTSLSMTKSISSDNEVQVQGNNNDASKYHLIWSPNFWKKMAITTLISAVAQFALKKNNMAGLDKMIQPLLSHECHHGGTPNANAVRRVVSAVALPLLSSSCCAIQLIINALSGWGCVGFNAYLGPIRPVLLPVLLFSTWKLLPQRSLKWTFLSLFLAFLPELVDIRNTYRSQIWQQKHSNNDGSKSMESAKSASMALPILSAKLRLEIPTMGCVACVNKVDTSIRQCKSAASIREETSWLTEGSAKGGMAELTISAGTNEEIDGIAKEVVAAVKNAGFQCTVESVQVVNK